MSVSFKIESSSGSYSVSIETGLLRHSFEDWNNAIAIADEWFSAELAAHKIPAIMVSAVEATKSMDSVPELIIRLMQMGANRQTRLVAIGGGIVQDVTAFIATVYMRGLEWVYFPTTVLAMADSCIGGKSSINVGPYKNLAGTFHPPSSVSIDPSMASTLTGEQIACGLVEAAKICYCRGWDTFAEYLAYDPKSDMPLDRLERVIVISLMTKKWFIETDEFDQAERLLLNFGHTFGHAIEGASHFRIAHGVAVGIGILCSIQLGRQLGRNYDKSTSVQRLESHMRDMLSEIASLPRELDLISLDEVQVCFQADKKHRKEWFNTIVPADGGEVETVQLPRNGQSLDAVRFAVARVIGTF